MPASYYTIPMDIKEFARLGGKARQKSLTPQERTALGRKGANKRWGNDASKLLNASKLPLCKRGTNYYQCSVHNQPLTMCVQQGYSLE